jgi:hypothetical protein
MGQTVNLLSYDFEGSNPSFPTQWNNQIPGQKDLNNLKAEVAHLVERQPSKLRVAGSSPVFRSNKIANLITIVEKN